MANRGKSKSPRGRGRKAKAVAEQAAPEPENGADAEVPELDDPPPPSVNTPSRASLRLSQSLTSHISNDDDDDDGIEEIPQEVATEDISEEATTEDISQEAVTEDISEDDPNIGDTENKMAVNEEQIDESEEKNQVEDAEMVSEDEYFAENKEPLDTEAVSDDELKEESQGLPETEAVSDDELPEEKRKKIKVAEAEAVSEDELPDEGEKKQKESVNGEKVVEEDEAKNEGKRKLADGEYDPSSPTSEHSADGSPANKKAAVGDGQTPVPKPTGKKAMPELEKYWKAVKDDPADFTGWTYLLQYVDQENDIEVAREAYDAFLDHYPYCYGYWRKYADLEKRKGHVEECEKVFERGLKAIPLSVDLWLHYLNYCKAAHPDNVDFVRSQFERAVKACGLEFRSDRLWESYIKWEKEKKNLGEVTSIYDRLLAIPTQAYTTHFDSFQEHITSNAPQAVIGVDDFLELRRTVLAELKKNEKPAPTIVPGDDAPPGDDGGEKEEDTGVSMPARMEEETSALREKIISSRRKVHKATVAAVAARWNYEEGIKRPYFHVKPLERCQLKNWKEYLDFEIEQGDDERISTLFERCLIACALYEEFWVRYIKYLESIPGDQTGKIRDIYERACTIHHKKKPNLHLQWAVFEETTGNFDRAAEILTNLDKTSPNMLQVAYRRINLERRRGNLAETSKLYEHYIEANKNKTIVNNMTVKYARFTWKFLNDIDKAIEILENALDKDKDNTRLYLQLIDMGIQRSPVDEDRIVAILDQFLNKEGDLEQKLMFAQRKIEFLEDFGSSIETVQKAQDDFQKYIKLVKEKKKKADDLATAAHSAAASISAPPTAASKTKTDSASKTSSAVTSAPPVPNVPPPSSAPNSNFTPPAGYPPNYYGQYPPPTGTGDQTAYPNNYPPSGNYNYNWNQYPQGSYGNYGQQGWSGYGYPNY